MGGSDGGLGNWVLILYLQPIQVQNEVTPEF